jgi:hypothetical protein
MMKRNMEENKNAPIKKGRAGTRYLQPKKIHAGTISPPFCATILGPHLFTIL